MNAPAFMRWIPTSHGLASSWLKRENSKLMPTAMRPRSRGPSPSIGVRLEHWRRERHDVSYRAVTPPANDVAAMQTDAGDVIAAAEAFVEAAEAD